MVPVACVFTYALKEYKFQNTKQYFTNYIPKMFNFEFLDCWEFVEFGKLLGILEFERFFGFFGISEMSMICSAAEFADFSWLSAFQLKFWT